MPRAPDTITASYTDSSGNFNNSLDNSHTLTVGAASATSLSLTAVNITPNLSSMNAQVTLTVQVSNPSGTVGEGVVSITFGGVTGQASVVNGTATVQLTVPIQSVANNSNVTLSYTDNVSSPSFANSTATPLLSFNIITATFPSSLSFASDGTELIQIQVSGQELFGYAYSATGLLEQINLSSVTLPVAYTTFGSQVVVTIDGVPWQVISFSNGQLQSITSLSINPDGSSEWIVFGPNGQIIGAQPS